MIKDSLKLLGVSKRKIAKGIYLLTFDERREMCKTMLRFEEHHESPEFSGKIFTLKQFKDWYKTTRNGRFTYYNDWGGFNVPSHVFAPFRQGKFNPLSKREKALLDIISNIEEPSCVICSPKGNGATIRHEAAHGLFYTNKEYRNKVMRVLEKCDISKARDILLVYGYCEKVVMDELNAYAVDPNPKIFDDQKTIKKLGALFDRYFEAAVRNK